MTKCPECGTTMQKIRIPHWSGNEVWFECLKCSYQILEDFELGSG